MNLVEIKELRWKNPPLNPDTGLPDYDFAQDARGCFEIFEHALDDFYISVQPTLKMEIVGGTIYIDGPQPDDVPRYGGAHVETINIMKGANIEGDIISFYADDQGRGTKIILGLKPDAEGKATSMPDDGEGTLVNRGTIAPGPNNGYGELHRYVNNVHIPGHRIGTLAIAGNLDMRSQNSVYEVTITDGRYEKATSPGWDTHPYWYTNPVTGVLTLETADPTVPWHIDPVTGLPVYHRDIIGGGWGAGASDRLVVSGTTQLGGTLRVYVTPGDYSPNPTTYTIIRSEGGYATGLNFENVEHYIGFLTFEPFGLNASKTYINPYNSTLNQVGDKVKSDDYLLGAYFVAAPFNEFEFKAYIGLGCQEYASERRIYNANIITDRVPLGNGYTDVLRGVNDRYTGKTGGNSFNVSLELARPLELHPMFILRPTLGIDVQHVWQSGYTENDFREVSASYGSNIYALRYLRSHYNRELLRAGFSSESSGPRGGIRMRAFYVSQIAGDQYPTATARFATGGERFTVRGVDMGKGYLHFGVGFNYWLDGERTSSLVFDYDANIYGVSHKVNAHLVSVGLVQNF